MDELRSMAVFIQIVDSGSLAAAADREGISPTMAGNHLRALERKLGVRLLNRTTRRLGLTEAGLTYCEQARHILQLIRDAHATASQRQATPEGRLRIAAPVSFGTERLAPALGEFLAWYPGISVDLVLSDRVADLVEDGFDAAIRIGSIADSDLVAHRLQSYRMWICAAPSYLAAKGMPASFQDLAHHECLSFAYSSGEWRTVSSPAATRVMVKGRLQINNGQGLRTAACAGLGIVMQPEVLLADDVAGGRLVRLFPDLDLPDRPMHLVYLPNRPTASRLRCFVEFVTGRFGG